MECYVDNRACEAKFSFDMRGLDPLRFTEVPMVGLEKTPKASSGDCVNISCKIKLGFSMLMWLR